MDDQRINTAFSLVKRFEHMGWSDPHDPTDPHKFYWENFTPVGKRRMKEISDKFKKEFPLFFAKDAPECPYDDYLSKFSTQLISFCADFPPPALNNEELRYFCTIVLWFAKTQG